jgi:hypothetical protein
MLSTHSYFRSSQSAIVHQQLISLSLALVYFTDQTRILGEDHPDTLRTRRELARLRE